METKDEDNEIVEKMRRAMIFGMPNAKARKLLVDHLTGKTDPMRACFQLYCAVSEGNEQSQILEAAEITKDRAEVEMKTSPELADEIIRMIHQKNWKNLPKLKEIFDLELHKETVAQQVNTMLPKTQPIERAQTIAELKLEEFIDVLSVVMPLCLTDQLDVAETYLNGNMQQIIQVVVEIDKMITDDGKYDEEIAKEICAAAECEYESLPPPQQLIDFVKHIVEKYQIKKTFAIHCVPMTETEKATEMIKEQAEKVQENLKQFVMKMTAFSELENESKKELRESCRQLGLQKEAEQIFPELDEMTEKEKQRIANVEDYWDENTNWDSPTTNYETDKRRQNDYDKRPRYNQSWGEDQGPEKSYLTRRQPFQRNYPTYATAKKQRFEYSDRPFESSNTFKLPENYVKNMIDTKRGFDTWVDENYTQTFGIDSEGTHMTRGVSLVQFAKYNEVFLVDIQELRELGVTDIWPRLGNCILYNDKVQKLGFAFDNDLRYWEIEAARYGERLDVSKIKCLDLQTYAAERARFDSKYCVQKQQMSLNDLTNICFRKSLDKTFQERSWILRPILEDMRKYAALDAYVLIKIHDHMENRNVRY